jgi:hypothetical protein
MASGSMHGMSFHSEATYGAGAGANPVMTPVLHSGGSLNLTKDFFESQTIRSNRQRTDGTPGAHKVGGEVAFELSYGAFDVWLEALLCGSWTNNVLKAGVTRRSFYVEEDQADIVTGRYQNSVGVELDSMKLQINANAKVTGSFGLIGKDQSLADAIISGETYAAESTTVPFNTFTGSISEGGSSSAVITELALDLQNKLEPRFVIGSQATLQPGIGRSTLSGSLNAWFESTALLTKFINDTASSISVTLTDGAANSLTILIPRIRYTACNRDVKGEGPLQLAMSWEADYEPTTSLSNIVLTRAPHA